MRAYVCAAVAAIVVAAHPASAGDDRGAAAFWKAVQARCDATAAKPPGALGRRIAQTAIDEFTRFGGHEIDADGRLFHFGLTEAEQEEEHGDNRPARLGQLGWWQVMKYWRSLYGNDAANELEVRGYGDASTSTDAKQTAALLRSDAIQLLRAADAVSDPAMREILREAALRAAVIDTPWSAAFISYVMKQSGVAAKSFHFANAHRVFIYEAFATSAGERAGKSDEKSNDKIYRACPVATTRPRVGDLICFQREPALADTTGAAVRERIRKEIAAGVEARSVRRTHCDVVAHVDVPARKMYVIGGNVYQSLTVKKLNLRRHSLHFSATQKGRCGGPGHWTLPLPAADAQRAASETQNCSLSDKKWFVLLQLR